MIRPTRPGKPAPRPEPPKKEPPLLELSPEQHLHICGGVFDVSAPPASECPHCRQVRQKQKPALLRFRCGHPADLTQLDCGECRAKARLAKQAKQQARRDAKMDANTFRYPDETHTAERWTGVAWVGTLHVPLPNCGPFSVLEAEGITGKEKLGRRFRELYVNWLNKQESDRG